MFLPSLNPTTFLPLILTSTLLSTTLVNAAYTLKDDYTPSTFFSQFTFFTDDDPTHGYVDYVSQSAATSASLINTNNNQVYMGVDYTSVASGRGRKSVRLTSKAVYNHALIILDLEHMPGNICGVWPAFWTVGPNWPNAGEIDIIEGVSGQIGNSMALHTGPGCAVSSSGSSNTSPNTGSAQAVFSGTVKTPNCDVGASNQPTNAGCAITSSDASTYGNGLNSARGGVYATQWTSTAINIWFFPRGSIPADIDSQSPSPSTWGAPMASFGGGGCNIDAAFKDQQIVFDTTFCGDWAGGVWSSDSTCSGKAATCQDYVKNNPAAFKDAYWAVNHLKVYTGADGGVAPSGSASAVPTTSRPIGSGMSSGVSVPPVVVTTTTTTTTTTVGMSKSQPTGPNPVVTSTVGSNPSRTTPIYTSTIPGAGYTPVPPAAPTPTPTTMATSRTTAYGNGNGNGNTYTYSSNNNGWGGRTRTQTWNRAGPPRFGRWASVAGYDGGDEVVDEATDMGRSGNGSGLGSGPASQWQEEGQEQGQGGLAGGMKELVRPVVRRDESGEVEVEGEMKRKREAHLGRHKERRHGWGL